MFDCQQILIRPNTELRAILEFICSESNKLANCPIYGLKQLYFKTRKVLYKRTLANQFKDAPHFGVFIFRKVGTYLELDLEGVATRPVTMLFRFSL